MDAKCDLRFRCCFGFIPTVQSLTIILSEKHLYAQIAGINHELYVLLTLTHIGLYFFIT